MTSPMRPPPTASLGIGDYPLAENRPDLVTGQRGKGLDEITLEALLEGEIALEDLTITATALSHQAEIARAAGRARLADNFERAAELVAVPQETIMRIYELLRPGRAKGPEEILAAARDLKEAYGAERLAAFLTEAAEVYAKRGLFKSRY